MWYLGDLKSKCKWKVKISSNIKDRTREEATSIEAREAEEAIWEEEVVSKAEATIKDLNINHKYNHSNNFLHFKDQTKMWWIRCQVNNLIQIKCSNKCSINNQECSLLANKIHNSKDKWWVLQVFHSSKFKQE